MNNPKTIEAIKVLYRGDIDDAPDFTYLFETSDGRYFKDYCGISLDQPCKKGGLKWRPTDPEYQLVRALCLQEEPKEQKSGYINADYLRTAIRDRMRTALADTRIHNDAIEAYREVARCIDYLAPAPVKEPEDEFEKWLVEGEWGTIEHVLEKYREIKQQGVH